MRTVALLAFALMLGAHLPAIPRLQFTPPEAKFGMILQGEGVHRTVVVTNREPMTVRVSFLPTCSCMDATPASAVLPAGGKAVFEISYDSTDDRGLMARSFLVTTDLPGEPPLPYWIRGTVREHRQQSPAPGPPAASGPSKQPPPSR